MEDKKTSREQKLAEKRQYWERHIQSWLASGLTQTEYQRKHNLSKWQFVYWKKKFERPVSSEVSLVPIPLPQTIPSTPIKLIINGRYRIEISEGFQSSVLEQVLEVVNRV
jgi:hypothetical protein